MQPEQKRMIRIIDLPGFVRVEDLVRLYYRPDQPTSPEFDTAVKALSKETFGIEEQDALAKIDTVFDEWDELEELTEGHEAFYDAANLLERSNEDAAELLKGLGLDFTDAKGWPILCTRFFKWQALAAVTGLAGKLPDVEAAGLRRIESSLEAEAKRFMERGRKP